MKDIYTSYNFNKNELLNFGIESLAADPPQNASYASRVYYNTAVNMFRFNNGSAWANIDTTGGLPFKGLSNTASGQGIYTIDGTGSFTLPAATGSGDRYVLAVKDVPPPTNTTYNSIGAVGSANGSLLHVPSSGTIVLEDNIVFPEDAYLTEMSYGITNITGSPTWSAQLFLMDVTSGTAVVAIWSMGESGITVPITGSTAIVLDRNKVYRVGVRSNAHAFDWLLHDNTSDALGNGGGANEAELTISYETIPQLNGFNVTLTGGDTMTTGDTTYHIGEDTVITFVDSDVGKWTAGGGSRGVEGAAGDPGQDGAEGPPAVYVHNTFDDFVDHGQDALYVAIDTYRVYFMDANGIWRITGDNNYLAVANSTALPAAGSTTVMYCTVDNNALYRWDSATSAYIKISQNDGSDESNVPEGVTFSLITATSTPASHMYLHSDCDTIYSYSGLGGNKKVYKTVLSTKTTTTIFTLANSTTYWRNDFRLIGDDPHILDQTTRIIHNILSPSIDIDLSATSTDVLGLVCTAAYIYTLDRQNDTLIQIDRNTLAETSIPLPTGHVCRLGINALSRNSVGVWSEFNYDERYIIYDESLVHGVQV